MLSDPSTGFIHLCALWLFIATLACRTPLWNLIPGRFPFETLEYPEPLQLQEQALLQAQEQALLQAQGQGLLQVWLCQMRMPVIRCVPGRSGMP